MHVGPTPFLGPAHYGPLVGLAFSSTRLRVPSFEDSITSSASPVGHIRYGWVNSIICAQPKGKKKKNLLLNWSSRAQSYSVVLIGIRSSAAARAWCRDLTGCDLLQETRSVVNPVAFVLVSREVVVTWSFNPWQLPSSWYRATRASRSSFAWYSHYDIMRTNVDLNDHQMLKMK